MPVDRRRVGAEAPGEGAHREPIETGRVENADRCVYDLRTRERGVPTSSIVDRFERSLEPGWLSRRVGPANQLRASVIHHQDMRRPLRLERAIPPERLTSVLDAVLTKTGGAGLRGSVKRAHGLRLRATDVDWAYGEGPEVTGPGESILMSLAGRTVALDDLCGAGFDELATRLLRS
jgi:hypothetical protein